MILGRDALVERWYTVGCWRMFVRLSERAEQAPVVVLVHGLGVSSRYMVPLARELAADFRVYSPDLPGFGRSDMPERALSVPELAEILRDWLDAAGIARALFVANSMGCQILTDLAALAPERICAAVLLGPTMDATAAHPLAHVWRLFKDQFREPLSLVPLQAFDYLTNGPLRTISTFRHALAHDMFGRIHHLTAPTVIVRGEHDETVSREWVAQLGSRLPRGRTLEIPGAGHALNYNSPAAIADVVRELANEVGC